MSYPEHLQLISGRRDNLSISRDFLDEEQGPLAVLLYVPDMEQHDHEHLSLDMETVKKLHSWLGEFIKDPPRQ